MGYLLDTNICIHLRRGNPVVSRSFVARQGIGVVSVISFGELLFGAERSGSLIAFRKLEELMETMHIEPLPTGAAGHYARIRDQLTRRGLIIGGNDLWIAADALAGDHTLGTDDEREFSRVDGLRIENRARDAQ